MNIEQIQQDLKTGQLSPPQLAEYKDWLSAESASDMDRQLELQLLFTDFFTAKRAEYKSDKAVQMAWQATPEGREQLLLETKQKKMKVLIQTISSHLRVAHDQALNLY